MSDSNGPVSEIITCISPFPTKSEQLVLRAERLYKEGGEERLDADDRREAVKFLMLARQDLSNTELGRIFKVSEFTIRSDKEVIRKRISEEVTDKDISVVVSDLVRSHEWRMSELARSMKKCTLGSPSYLNHIKAHEDFSYRIVEMLQSLGVYPKNLGNMTKTEFVYKAQVARGGGVNTTAVQSEKELKTIEAQEVKLLPGAHETDEDRAIRASLADEFADGSTLRESEEETPAASVGPTRLQRG